MRKKSSRAREPSEETFELVIDPNLHRGTGAFPFPVNKNQALRTPVDILRAQGEEVGGAGTCRPEKIQKVPKFLAPRAGAEVPVGGCGDREVILYAGPFGLCRNPTLSRPTSVTEQSPSSHRVVAGWVRDFERGASRVTTEGTLFGDLRK